MRPATPGTTSSALSSIGLLPFLRPPLAIVARRLALRLRSDWKKRARVVDESEKVNPRRRPT